MTPRSGALRPAVSLDPAHPRRGHDRPSRRSTRTSLLHPPNEGGWATPSAALVNLSDNAPDPTPTFATGSPNDLPTSGGSTVVPQPVNAQGSRDPDDPSIAVFTWEAPPEVPDAEFVYRIPNGEDKSLPAVSPLRLTNQDTMVCIALATRTQDSRMSEEFNVCS